MWNLGEIGSDIGKPDPVIEGISGTLHTGMEGPVRWMRSRHGLGDEINDGINWAYSGSSLDFTTVVIVLVILAMMIGSGYLIIYNIFLIAVTSDIHYYGLLKTVGMANR